MVVEPYVVLLLFQIVMAQQGLDTHERHPFDGEVCCERMSERMWGQLNAKLIGLTRKPLLNGPPANLLAIGCIQKQIWQVVPLRFKIDFQVFLTFLREEDDTGRFPFGI